MGHSAASKYHEIKEADCVIYLTVAKDRFGTPTDVLEHELQVEIERLITARYAHLDLGDRPLNILFLPASERQL